jgi:hypothetical protein
MPISFAVKSDKTTVPRWIKHFEEQAFSGTSSRSLFNKRLIVVEKFSPNKSINNHQQVIQNLPAIVSPVQQSIIQAEEEIKREVSETGGKPENSLFKKQIDNLSSPSQTVSQALNPVKKRRKVAVKRKITDIFSH